MPSFRNFFVTRPFIIGEFILLCGALPSAIIVHNLGMFMFTFLWGATLYCYLIFRLLPDRPRDVWGIQAVKWQNLRPILIRWVVCSLLLIPFTYWYDSSRLFYLPLHNPGFIPVLAVAYPLVSALPQEFIFCSFFFTRYAALFTTPRLMVLISALTFAYAHVLYINPVAPSIGFLGGLIFASTYARHKSLALVTIEHGLYGNTLFMVGLGYYFYSGAIAP